MTRICLLSLLLTVVSTPILTAQNKVFNTDAGKAWLVTYDEAGGNKRGDIAIQLKLTDKGGSAREFDGTLQRYNRTVPDGGGMRRYALRPEGGTVTIAGITEAYGPKKHIGFVGAGTYLDASKLHIVVVRGSLDEGKSSDRDDDRITIRITDRPYHAKKAQGASSLFTPAPARYQFVLFQADAPCDDEPDTDILYEAPYVAQPPYMP